MFKITRAARQILNSTKYIKAFTLSSIKAIDEYLNPSQSERFKDASHEFIFKKKLSEFVDFKVINSCGDFGGIQKEGTIDWVFARQLIYARFADEIGKQVVAHTKVEAVKGISEEFKDLRNQGYDFKKVSNLIEQQKGVVVNDCNISSASLIERMKKLSIAGYLSNYAGEQGLRQDIEEVMHKKAYVMQEFMMRVSGLPACEVQFDQLKQVVDILGDH